jgi:predicted nucleic acid-binding protein
MWRPLPTLSFRACRQVRSAWRWSRNTRSAARLAPGRDYDATRQVLLDLLMPVTMPVRAEERARELQRDLASRGRHRGVSVPDLVLAAIADIEELTILHDDADFDLISDVTGQPSEWVVPRGSID